MHPGFMGWWKHARGGGDCGAQAGCGPGHERGGHGWGGHGHGHGGHEGGWSASGDDGDFGGAPFGVRRPLRFLAFKLGLDDLQVAELARILADLKTERAQAAVDNRRAVTAFADVVGGDSFDPAKAAEASAGRAKTAERLGAAVAGALGRIHALLKPDQRQQLAYLIRTGALSI